MEVTTILRTTTAPHSGMISQYICFQHREAGQKLITWFTAGEWCGEKKKKPSLSLYF